MYVCTSVLFCNTRKPWTYYVTQTGSEFTALLPRSPEYKFTDVFDPCNYLGGRLPALFRGARWQVLSLSLSFYFTSQCHHPSYPTVNLNSDPALPIPARELPLCVESSPVFPSFSCRETVQGCTTLGASHTRTLGLGISQLVWKLRGWCTLAKALAAGTMYNLFVICCQSVFVSFFFHYLFIELSLAIKRNINSTLYAFVIFKFL